ncbi:MAG: DHH family phosphoesterase [Candidatus Komeilibacteria bacterium]|nr:DHH family phosphoesterase [Candidatus Komeilibacteria bacterium]
MSLEPLQQILAQLRAGKNILITTRANPSGDSIAATLAFYLLLKKQGKTATLAIDNAAVKLANTLDFLPGYPAIATTLDNKDKTIIEIDLKGSDFRGLTYIIKNGKLEINVLINKPTVDLNSPAIKQNDCPYDLVLVLDTPDLESLGKIYDTRRDFFYQVPIINIDHQADNEHFGELNLVELTAASTTEIIFNLIENWDKNLLDNDIATCLLTGIISESKSFQTNNITPRTLAIASELIARGARRELIVEKLYGNKPISTLQIWGRALSALRTEPASNLVWSQVTNDDFAATKTSALDLRNVIEELLSHAPQAKIVVLFYPQNEKMSALIHTHRPTFDLRKIFSSLAPQGARNFIECLLPNLTAVEAIDTIKQILHERAPRDEPLPKF